MGFIDGQNVVVEYHWAEGEYDRLPALAAELVRRRVDVIVACGRRLAARAIRSPNPTGSPNPQKEPRVRKGCPEPHAKVVTPSNASRRGVEASEAIEVIEAIA
jgi:hypothetical protein